MTIPTDTLLLAGIAVVLLALLGIAAWLSARLRGTVRDIQRALTSTRHAQAIAVPVGGAARQTGPFWEKQQEVYASLYARYRRACDSALPAPAHTPDFGRFSRDELLRYLSRRKVRERDATDAIAALDRGDTFAMARLMTRLHEKVDQRDASIALRRATRYEEINELYLSDAVRGATAQLRERLTPVDAAAPAGAERRTQGAAPGRRPAREIHDALAALQRVMRDELSGAQRPPVPAGPAARPSVSTEHSVTPAVHLEGVRTVS